MQRFTQPGRRRSKASVPNFRIMLIKSRVVHINLVGVRTKTAEEIELLIASVDCGTFRNPKDLDCSQVTVGIVFDGEFKAPFLQIVVVFVLSFSQDCIGELAGVGKSSFFLSLVIVRFRYLIVVNHHATCYDRKDQ